MDSDNNNNTINQNHKRLTYKCRYCGHYFTKSEAFISHQRDHIDGPRRMPPPPPRVPVPPPLFSPVVQDFKPNRHVPPNDFPPIFFEGSDDNFSQAAPPGPSANAGGQKCYKD